MPFDNDRYFPTTAATTPEQCEEILQRRQPSADRLQQLGFIIIASV